VLPFLPKKNPRIYKENDQYFDTSQLVGPLRWLFPELDKSDNDRCRQLSFPLSFPLFFFANLLNKFQLVALYFVLIRP
jgi:hypothetical protein